MWLLVLTLVGVPRAQEAQDEAGAAEDAPSSSGVDGLEATLRDIGTYFSDEVGEEGLYRAALEGVVRQLGKVMGTEGNRVLTQEERAHHEAWMRGERSGIGAEFAIVAGRGLVITDVFDQTPAQRNGLVRGDLVVALDNHPFTGLPRNAIHGTVSRSRGSVAVLDVRRTGGELRRVSVVRGSYMISPVQVGREGSAAVARIPFFGVGTADALADFLADQPDEAAVVIDLRDNDDGRLDEVVAAAELFLEPGAVVLHRGKQPNLLKPVRAETEPTWNHRVVLLVNRGTAGPAEAFASALQDHRRGVVIGTHSRGRAIHTSHYPAGHGLVLEIADTHLRSPGGRSWSDSGVVPDVMVESPSISMPTTERVIPPDLQRDAAIQLISAGSSH